MTQPLSRLVCLVCIIGSGLLLPGLAHPAEVEQTDAELERVNEAITEIEACHSVAGDAAYMLFVRVASPKALEALVNEVRHVASVNTRTTVVLQSFYEHRPMLPAEG